MPINPDSPELNYFTIRGVNSPGRCRIQGANRALRWKQNEGMGIIGSLNLVGLKLAEFSIFVDMWTKEQLAEWEFFVQILPPPEVTYGSPAAYRKLVMAGHGISHPILASNGINSVVLQEIGQLTLNRGLWTSEIKFIEFRKPVTLPIGSVNRTVPAVKKGPEVTAVTEADKALVEGRKAAAAAKAAAGG